MIAFIDLTPFIPPPAEASCGLLALKLQRRQAGRPLLGRRGGRDFKRGFTLLGLPFFQRDRFFNDHPL
jgi:hypothetical protein